LLRSLLIGFLIFSALSSNGAGAQSTKSVNITTDMLLELFNTVAVNAGRVGVHSTTDKAAALCDASKASALLSARRGAGFFACGSLDTSETDDFFSSCAALWPEYCDYNYNSPAQKLFIMHAQPINSGAPYCVSGLSPPYFRV